MQNSSCHAPVDADYTSAFELDPPAGNGSGTVRHPAQAVAENPSRGA